MALPDPLALARLAAPATPVLDMPDQILLALADDAFVVLNWARRAGLKRDQQMEQVVLAFRKTLTDNRVAITAAADEVNR